MWWLIELIFKQKVYFIPFWLRWKNSNRIHIKNLIVDEHILSNAETVELVKRKEQEFDTKFSEIEWEFGEMGIIDRILTVIRETRISYPYLHDFIHSELKGNWVEWIENLDKVNEMKYDFFKILSMKFMSIENRIVRENKMETFIKDSTMISNTYIPGTTKLFRMIKVGLDERATVAQEETNETWEDNGLVKPGISNGCTLNKLYKDLLIDLELANIDSSTICEVYLNWIHGNGLKSTFQKKSDFSYHLLIQEVDPRLKQVIVRRKEQGFRLQEISHQF